MHAMTIGEVAITSTNRFVSYMDVEACSTAVTSGKGHVYVVRAPALDADVLYVRWDNGEREVRFGDIRIAPPAIINVRNGRRLCLVEKPDGGRPGAGSRYVFLKQARIKDAQYSSGLYPATLEALNEGAGLDVTEMLIALGARQVATKGYVLGDRGKARSLYIAVFAAEDEAVPVAAFAMTRILPLLHGVTHSKE